MAETELATPTAEAVSSPVATVLPPEPASAPLAPSPAADLPAVIDAGPLPAVIEPSPPPAVVESHPVEIPTRLESAGKLPQVVEPPGAVVDAPPSPPAMVLVEPTPVYKFDLPATLADDPVRVGSFTTLLTEHKISPAAGQALMNMHAEAMTAYAAYTFREQIRAFNEMRREWAKRLPAQGENPQEEAAVARMRDLLLSDAQPGTPKHQSDMDEHEHFLRVTGAGDHPVYWRILLNAARYFDEAKLPPPDPMPTRSNGQRPVTRLRDTYERGATS